MPKKCIGIDIGRVHVRAAQMARTSEGLHLEKTFETQTRRSTDSLVAILRSLTQEQGFDPRAEVAVSLPHHVFFFADVQTDAAGLAALQAGDASCLKNCFPIPVEDAIAQVCTAGTSPDGRKSLLIAAISYDPIREHLASLEEAGIKPNRVDAPMIAAQTAILTNHPAAARGLAVILYVDESTLSIAVTEDGGLLLVRNLPMFAGDSQNIESLAQQTAEIVAQEIEITWKRLFAKDPEPGLCLFLIASGRLTELLVPALREKIDSRIVPVRPYADTAGLRSVESGSSLCIAEGLALRALHPPSAEPVDFLAAYRAKTEPAVRPRRELAICGCLVAAIAAVWVVSLFLQLSSLESRYASLKVQEQTIFRRAIPDEPTLVNAVAQLQQRLDVLRKDCATFTCFNPGRPTALEILYLLSRQVPATGTLRLHDVLIAGDSVAVVGVCDSFNTFFEWRALIENTPQLRFKSEPQPQKTSDSKVEFRASLSTTEKKPT